MKKSKATAITQHRPGDLDTGLDLGDTVTSPQVAREEPKMAEGTIKRLTDKGFGFISNASGKDLFFHMSAVEGVRFEDLREGQKVSYNEGVGPKGPRAENVRPI
jgi:CspA family cold shock protein